MPKEDFVPVPKVIVREEDGQFRILAKDQIDLSNYEFVGMKQFNREQLEEYHAK